MLLKIYPSKPYKNILYYSLRINKLQVAGIIILQQIGLPILLEEEVESFESSSALIPGAMFS